MSLSLKLRQGLISLLLFAFLLPGSFIAIERAFYTQLVTNTEQKLEVHLYAILSEIQVSADKVQLSNVALAPDFSRPNSGLSAFITNESDVLWQSDSSITQQFEPELLQLLPGKSDFRADIQYGQKYWVLSIALLFDQGDSTIPLTVHVVQSDHLLNTPHQSFLRTLIRWYLGIALVLLLVMLLAYRWTTRPLSMLDHEIRRVESGKQEQLTGKYPTELMALKEDLNLLLASQNRQKQRYRHHLSDLAHALKTPLAVLNTSPLSEQPELKEQLDRISAMIDHQLKRASSSGQDVWKKQIPLQPLLDKMINALGKIYQHKGCHIVVDCPEDTAFKGDETDMMEILGNLLDNACKACQYQVRLHVSSHPFTLVVEDDGPGIPSARRQQLFQRGTRLDTYKEGHGVGLSIVAELVSSYNGDLEVGDSELGGARFQVRFPDL
ncbi:ATP-binding protein [Alkalimonas amylolytica]|uniref:histidine kinase n=1 Tax=Alkalimonas amylolytica TaxID=152573 RepID=A0A1H4CAK5_ALKAM|nr:ATP-binding protein [Alkalimonas amylolytica]SEA57404.1 two-component system, OmpR family, sensor histidine kinase PhoQ [Alkalimonas amylolytica]